VALHHSRAGHRVFGELDELLIARAGEGSLKRDAQGGKTERIVGFELAGALAAILGDTVNYHIGKYLGLRVLSGRLSRWLNPAHLKKTEQFFEKYGAKTIILARFVPIVRTFAPFVAGVGSMNYRRFVIYNIAGAVLWVFSLTFVGYIFGDRLKDHFEIVVLVIVFLSILPAVAEYLRHRFAAKTPAATPMEAEP
jgi:membrane-associated protein